MTSPSPTPAPLLRRLARAIDFRTPIFSKEVTVSGRRISTYITRAVYALLMLALASIAYFSATAGLEMKHVGAEWVQRVQSLAPRVSITILWFQFVVLALFACVLTSGSFCDERRHGTLGALFTTPLTAVQMCLGKVAGHMIQIFILIAIAAPLLLALRVFGGIDSDVILLGLGLVLSTALLGATAAMFHSVFAKRSVSAASAAVFTLLLCYGLPPLALWGLQSNNLISFRLDLFAMLSPPVTMGALTAYTEGSALGTIFSLYAICLGAMAYNAALSILFFFGTTALVRRAMIRDAGERRVDPKRPKRALRSSPLPAQPEELAAPDPAQDAATAAVKRKKRRIQVTHAAGPVHLGDHPVRWRELRQPMVNVGWTVRLAVLGILLVSGLYLHYLAARHNGFEPLFIVTSVIGTVITCFVATVGTAGAISQERESRTLETLLCTPLSAWNILAGKFWGTFRRQLLVPAFVIAHLGIGVLEGFTIQPVTLLHAVIILVPPVAFLCATGSLCSVLLRKGTAAAIANFLIAVTLWAGTPFVCAILEDVFRRRSVPHALFQHMLTAVFSVNPAVMMGSAVNANVSDGGGRSTSNYEMPSSTNFSLVEFLLLESLVAVGFCMSAYVVLRLAARILALRSGRLSATSSADRTPA